MIQLIIIGIVAFVFSFWFIVHISKSKERHETSYIDIARRHARTQDRIQAEINRRNQAERIEEHLENQREQIINGVDRWRAEHGLPRIYGINGIREQMHRRFINNEGRVQVVDRAERLVINKRIPSEGDVKFENIIANEPDKGQRKYIFHDGRWWFHNTIPPEPIDFITEEDIFI